MAIIESMAIAESEAFKHNRATHLELIGDFRALEAKVLAASARAGAADEADVEKPERLADELGVAVAGDHGRHRVRIKQPQRRDHEELSVPGRGDRRARTLEGGGDVGGLGDYRRGARHEPDPARDAPARERGQSSLPVAGRGHQRDASQQPFAGSAENSYRRRRMQRC